MISFTLSSHISTLTSAQFWYIFFCITKHIGVQEVFLLYINMLIRNYKVVFAVDLQVLCSSSCSNVLVQEHIISNSLPFYFA